MLTITKTFKFNAAHRYRKLDWTDDENVRVFGKDFKTHGHNYELEVTLAGPVNTDTGFSADLADLKGVVERQVIDILDHSQIELDIGWFAERQPSSENLVLFIWQQLHGKFRGNAELVKVRLYETTTIYAEYDGEPAIEALLKG